MSILSRLFGGTTTSNSQPEPVDYNGFLIFPQPIREDGGYRVSARIEKEIGGELKTHTLIRADKHATEDTATDASLFKARQVIDQIGEGLFD